MASTWYSRRGEDDGESYRGTQLRFDGTRTDVEKFFFYFENVVTRNMEPEERAVRLLGFLVGEAFDYYYDQYASNGTLLEAGKDYLGGKEDFIRHCGRKDSPEENIRKAVSASLDASDLLSSLRGMDTLFERAAFDENAKFGLFRRAIMEHTEMAQCVMFHSPKTYEDLKNSVRSFVMAKEAFTVNLRSQGPGKIIQRPDAGQRKIEEKVDALATQLSQLTLIVKKSQTADLTDRGPKYCSYCRETGHFATSCPGNEHRTTRCTSCGKLDHPESRCFKKQKETGEQANVVTHDVDEGELPENPTVGVTLVCDQEERRRREVIAAVKRNFDAEAIPKQVRTSGTIPISSLLAPPPNPQVARARTRQKRKKTKTTRAGSTDCVGKYNVVSELANASSGITFGQLVRGDGDKARSEIRRLLTRGTKARRNVAAAVGSHSQNARPRRFKVVQVDVFGTSAEALLDSGAVPNLISRSICEKLHLKIERKSTGLTVADGQKVRSIGIVADVHVSFDELHASMGFFVMKHPPFDVTIRVPTLEALVGCSDCGMQQVTLSVGERKAVLPFAYMTIEGSRTAASETDSEDFTSQS